MKDLFGLLGILLFFFVGLLFNGVGPALALVATLLSLLMACGWLGLLLFWLYALRIFRRG